MACIRRMSKPEQEVVTPDGLYTADPRRSTMSAQSTDTPLFDNLPDESSPVEYRLIPGFPGYRVGDDGSVWSRIGRISLGFGKGSRTVLTEAWKPLKPKHGDGQLIVQLYGQSKTNYRKIRLVHHLVLEAFVGPCPEGMECCHEDGDPTNNRLANLRWDTKKANEADKRRHGTSCVGERNGRVRITASDVIEIRKLRNEGLGDKRIAARLGLPRGAVVGVIARGPRRSWKHLV